MENEFNIPELENWSSWTDKGPEDFKDIKDFLEFLIAHAPPTYVLKNGKPVPASFEEMAKQLSDFKLRRVDCTKVSDTIEVSTVFLGIAHGPSLMIRAEGIYIGNEDASKPLLYETMIFGGKLNNYQRRYHTLGEAKKGHWEIVEMAKADL